MSQLAVHEKGREEVNGHQVEKKRFGKFQAQVYDPEMSPCYANKI